MTILLTHDTMTKTIEAKADAEFATNIMEKAKWTMTHVSDNNMDHMLHDFRIAMPSITAPDVMSIKSAMDTDSDYINKFIAICNILSKAPVFSISPCIEFKF